MISTPEVITTQEIEAAVIPLLVPGREMPKYMDPAIQELIKAITGQGITINGPMFSFHKRRPSETFDVEIGFPVARTVRPEGRVIRGKLPGVKVVRSVYQGPYEGLAQAWPELQSWVRKQGHGEMGRFWESYLTNPEDVKDPRNYRTELNWIVNGN